MSGVLNPDGSSAAPVSYYPNDNLVAAITRAWTDDDFRKRLLTRDKYVTTSAALAEMVVFFPNPIVLTQTEFDKGYTKAAADETVFVLPDPPASPAAKYSSIQANASMRITIRGM